MDEIKLILKKIYNVAGTDCFPIPPGDYKHNAILPKDFLCYQSVVEQVFADMGKGTINSIKKNFFPDLEKMGFLARGRVRMSTTGKLVLHGKLNTAAVELIKAETLIDSYKKFTDGIDKLFGNKLSELADMLYLSDYANELISIYEFMFILSDDNEDIDKIALLASYRCLKKHKRTKVINLIKEYANPKNFKGDKTSKRDFHNWKNQAQQIMRLMKTTVYFAVDQNKSFRLNVGSTGFFQAPGKRSEVPKREYFKFHRVSKRDKFELHHIVPIASARNKNEAKLIDDYRNLLYIHRGKHKEISRKGNINVVLSIDRRKAVFASFDSDTIKAINNKDAFYAKEKHKIKKVAKYNAELLEAIFEFP